MSRQILMTSSCIQHSLILLKQPAIPASILSGITITKDLQARSCPSSSLSFFPLTHSDDRGFISRRFSRAWPQVTQERVHGSELVDRDSLD